MNEITRPLVRPILAAGCLLALLAVWIRLEPIDPTHALHITLSVGVILVVAAFLALVICTEREDR